MEYKLIALDIDGTLLNSSSAHVPHFPDTATIEQTFLPSSTTDASAACGTLHPG